MWQSGWMKRRKASLGGSAVGFGSTEPPNALRNRQAEPAPNSVLAPILKPHIRWRRYLLNLGRIIKQDPVCQRKKASSLACLKEQRNGSGGTNNAFPYAL